MRDKEIRRILDLIKSSGFYKQNNRKVRNSFEITDSNNRRLVEELKFIEFVNDSDLSNEELFDLYQIVASLHDFDENYEKKILYQLRSIKYRPSDIEIRYKYLSNFWDYILENRSKLGKAESDILRREFVMFREYAHMKWGDEGKLYNKTLMILEELNAPHPDESSDKLKNFIYDWEKINRKFRPDKQALDYAIKSSINK